MNSADWDKLTEEEKELLLDVGQLALDIVGVVEPTPFADSSNAVISLTRGDWAGALMSAAGIIPYVGDVAKLGKLPRYAKSIDRALAMARTSARFAEPMRALATRIVAAIRRLPADKLPPAMRKSLDNVHRKLTEFLGGGLRLSRLDRLTDETLRAVFGSTKNAGVLPRQNVRKIVEFFDESGVGGGSPAEWANLIKGIDVHAVDAVQVVDVPARQTFAQFVELSRPADRRVGQWMVPAQGGVSHRNVGLSGAGRERQLFRLKPGAKAASGKHPRMLVSKAAATGDHWTVAGARQHGVVTRVDGRHVMKQAEFVAGGGQQLFLPRAWDLLEAVKP
ncbi:MAG: hypothetical protein AAFV43_15090 [Planctomycetota bacterium]